MLRLVTEADVGQARTVGRSPGAAGWRIGAYTVDGGEGNESTGGKAPTDGKFGFRVEFLTPNRWSRRPGREASPYVSVGRRGSILATLPRLPDPPAHPRGAAARGTPYQSRRFTGKIRHPQTYAGRRAATQPQRFEGAASGQINIEAMIANWQHADLASFTEAWDRGDHWRAAIRTSIATYDEDFQSSFRTVLAKVQPSLVPRPPITILQISQPNRIGGSLGRGEGRVGTSRSERSPWSARRVLEACASVVTLLTFY